MQASGELQPYCKPGATRCERLTCDGAAACWDAKALTCPDGKTCPVRCLGTQSCFRAAFVGPGRWQLDPADAGADYAIYGTSGLEPRCLDNATACDPLTCGGNSCYQASVRCPAGHSCSAGSDHKSAGSARCNLRIPRSKIYVL